VNIGGFDVDVTWVSDMGSLSVAKISGVGVTVALLQLVIIATTVLKRAIFISNFINFNLLVVP
jgi:hypothetical protein